MTSTPSRRQVLVAAGGVALLPVTACTKDDKPAKLSTDDVIRAAAVERERALLALYAGATTPAALAVRADHEEHLAALTRQSTPSAVASPSAGTSLTTTAPAKAALVAAERGAATAHAAAALDASPELAALLASLAASEASHPVALA